MFKVYLRHNNDIDATYHLNLSDGVFFRERGGVMGYKLIEMGGATV